MITPSPASLGSVGPGAPPLAWLGSVREVSRPLDRLNPIGMHESRIAAGPALPQPTIPCPESHPYCEFTLALQGRGTHYIGHESRPIRAGAVLLLGPHLPHTAEVAECPMQAITAYVLPILFLEMGPNGDGARLLRRFTAEQPMAERIVYPPAALWRQLRQGMARMLEESRHGGFGREVRLRTLLMDMLVALVRWEDSAGGRVARPLAPTNWSHIQKAIHYIHEHHAEVIYVRQIARALGVGERQLNGLFRELLGMSCIQYLNEYRVSLAASMLAASSPPITTVAFEVGFESLSHFNTTFHKVIGMSPTEYIGRKRKAG